MAGSSCGRRRSHPSERLAFLLCLLVRAHPHGCWEADEIPGPRKPGSWNLWPIGWRLRQARQHGDPLPRARSIPRTTRRISAVPQIERGSLSLSGKMRLAFLLSHDEVVT
jgi:hypothetical protein